MRAFLIDLLKRLEELIPPPPNCHHAITYAQYGSDEAGWSDRLVLQVNEGCKFQQFFIGPEEEAKSALDLAEEIAAIQRSPSDDLQAGVATGQYI